MREEDVYHLQRQIKKLYRRVQRETPVIEGLSMTTLQTLATLERSGTAMRPSELGAELQMTSSNVAAALRVLDEQGLIERRADPDDGRKAYVDLTTEGEKLIKNVRRTRHAWLQEAADDLLSPQEQRILRKAGELMERLAERS